MRLWLIKQDINTGYDTYDSAVVATPDAETAKRIHPSSFCTHEKDGCWMGTYSGGPNTGAEYKYRGEDTWVLPSQCDAEEIGETKLAIGTIVCASFNAG